MWRHLRAIFGSFLAIFCFKRPLLGPARFGTFFFIFLGKFNQFKIILTKKVRCGAMRSNSWFMVEIRNLADFDKISKRVVKWLFKSATVKKSRKNVKFWSFFAIFGHITKIWGGSEGSNIKSFITYSIWYSNWSSLWGCFKKIKIESFEVMWRRWKASFD